MSSGLGAPLPGLAGPWTPTVPALRGVLQDGASACPPTLPTARRSACPPRLAPPVRTLWSPALLQTLLFRGPKSPQKPSISQPIRHHPKSTPNRLLKLSPFPRDAQTGSCQSSLNPHLCPPGGSTAAVVSGSDRSGSSAPSVPLPPGSQVGPCPAPASVLPHSRPVFPGRNL